MLSRGSWDSHIIRWVELSQFPRFSHLSLMKDVLWTWNTFYRVKSLETCRAGQDDVCVVVIWVKPEILLLSSPPASTIFILFNNIETLKLNIMASSRPPHLQNMHLVHKKLCFAGVHLPLQRYLRAKLKNVLKLDDDECGDLQWSSAGVTRVSLTIITCLISINYPGDVSHQMLPTQ